MKKKLTKKQDGGMKSRTVIKSDDGNYKTVEKRTSGPRGYSDSSKTRRTVKGVVAGAPKPNISPMMGPPPTTPPQIKKPIMAKKGGGINKKK
jgi:hypothetical protein